MALGWAESLAVIDDNNVYTHNTVAETTLLTPQLYHCQVFLWSDLPEICNPPPPPKPIPRFDGLRLGKLRTEEVGNGSSPTGFCVWKLLHFANREVDFLPPSPICAFLATIIVYSNPLWSLNEASGSCELPRDRFSPWLYLWSGAKYHMHCPRFSLVQEHSALWFKLC